MPLPSSCAPSRALFVVLWVIGSSLAFGQIQTTNRTLENLKREFTDPLTTLPQVFLKDAFSPVNYGTNVQTNQVVAELSFREFRQTLYCLSSNLFDRPSRW